MDAQIDAQFRAIADDVLAWKLRGAACWHAAGAAAAAAATLVLLPPPSASSSSSSSSSSLAAALLASLLVTYGTTVLVLRAQRNVLAARDVPPVRLPLPPFLVLGGRGPRAASAAAWPPLFASRCVLRTRRPADVIAALELYGAYALSGAVGVGVLGGSGGSFGGATAAAAAALFSSSATSSASSSSHSFPWLYGLVLGLTCAAGHLLGCRNVVSYPSVDLQRWPRLRRRARAAARSALATSTAVLLPSLAVWWWCWGSDNAAISSSSLLGLSASGLLRAWRAAVAVSLAWLAGAHALDVVWSEPLQFCGGDASARAGDEAARAAAAAAAASSASSSSAAAATAAAASAACQPTALLAALRHPDPVVQDWAMRDLCQGVAERGGARRRALFADATGATGWAPATAACLAEVRRACEVLSWGEADGGTLSAAASYSSSPKKAAAAASRRASAAAGAAGGATASADLAGWHLRAYTPRLAWAARALAALCAASRTEDAYGLALLPAADEQAMRGRGGGGGGGAAVSAASSSTPLGEAVVALLALEAALDARRRAVARASAIGEDQPPLMDAAAEALADAVRASLYRVAAAFGGGAGGGEGGGEGGGGEALLAVVRQQPGVLPPLRSSAEAAARLRRYYAGEL
jgi:hypothetical protein